ncbi:alpha/beta hydrolase-fold protein [Gynuella sunshinyii]|uniref:Putative peptidase n=1 Tax=Gynuella sunshinyii YC6258 TaxID=1445510 RepID=A0A0C5VB27_9GAMM|nr:alpha/beta hydrolase-fold protein [Gynuella sunshinyii]AJQ96550.1 putative peptidase [Gynuella sunshinyii YC6258]
MSKVVMITSAVLAGVIVLALVAGISFMKMKGWSRTSVLLALKMEADQIKDDQHVLPYRLYQPDTDTQQSLPLILVLHGAGERGTDNIRQLNYTIKQLVSSEFQSIQPAFILAPQSPPGQEWTDNQVIALPAVNYDIRSSKPNWKQHLLIQLIHQLTVEYPIDTTRIYLTGFSMGATGSWEMLYHYPQIFSAAAILSGRSDPAIAETLKDIPIAIFHGKEDKTAPLENSLAMYQALKPINPLVTLNVLEAGHNISGLSYTTDLYRWLVNH